MSSFFTKLMATPFRPYRPDRPILGREDFVGTHSEDPVGGREGTGEGGVGGEKAAYLWM